MNISIDVRLDLSPALAAAIQEVTRALGGRGLPPLRPYEKPDALYGCQQQKAAERPASAAPIVQVDTVADVEISTAPPAEPIAAAKAEGPRWTVDRHAILDFYYPAGDALPEILARLNALPGPEVSYDQMKSKIIYRGLKRADQPVKAAPPVRTPPGPVEADDATIRHWAAARGLCNGAEPIDMDRINAKRVQLGLSPYRRVNGLQASAGTLRSAQMGDAR